MPGFDGTGPLGLGPMTGRGMGYCVMCLPSSISRMGWGYAGLPAWPFISVPGWRVFPAYGAFAGGFSPAATGLFLPFRPSALPRVPAMVSKTERS
jgi:hypothetical protein